MMSMLCTDKRSSPRRIVCGLRLQSQEINARGQIFVDENGITATLANDIDRVSLDVYKVLTDVDGVDVKGYEEQLKPIRQGSPSPANVPFSRCIKAPTRTACPKYRDCLGFSPGAVRRQVCIKVVSIAPQRKMNDHVEVFYNTNIFPISSLFIHTKHNCRG
jgi:hypothetical protein